MPIRLLLEVTASYFGRETTSILSLISFPDFKHSDMTKATWHFFSFTSSVTDTWTSSIYGFACEPWMRQRTPLCFKAWGKHSCNKKPSVFPSWAVIQHVLLCINLQHDYRNRICGLSPERLMWTMKPNYKEISTPKLLILSILGVCSFC